MRGSPDDAHADEVLAFWAARGALLGEAARQRLAELACVLRSGGVVAGVSSVYPADVPLIGGRRFWIYRSLLDAEAAEHATALIRATFNALEADFDGSPGAPIGLCVLLDDAERRRRPEAEWSDPRMIYAGYLMDGRQVRVAYFTGAVVTLP